MIPHLVFWHASLVLMYMHPVFRIGCSILQYLKRWLLKNFNSWNRICSRRAQVYTNSWIYLSRPLSTWYSASSFSNHPYFCSGGEMVDTGDLKSPGSNSVLVRVQSRALFSCLQFAFKGICRAHRKQHTRFWLQASESRSDSLVHTLLWPSSSLLWNYILKSNWQMLSMPKCPLMRIWFIFLYKHSWLFFPCKTFFL